MSPDHVIGLSVLIALAAGGLATAQSEEDPTQLQPIIVVPKVNPLDESIERLRKMMEDPSCAGCGPLIEASRESVYDQAYYGVGAVLSFLSGMPEKPPVISAAERAEGRIANDWRQFERDPDR